MTTPEASVSLVLDDGFWIFPDDTEANLTKVQERLRSLADLEATDYDLMAPLTREMGSVEVVLEARDGALRLPTSALLEGDRVLVASDGRLEERPVEIGLKNWDYAEVKSGLDEGQRVVISLDRVEVKS